MALSPKDILTALQWEFLSIFFQGASGVSQAMLAYLLSEFRLSKIPEFMIVPISLEELQEYFQLLAGKLAVESFPH